MYPLTRRWMGPRANLDVLEKRTLSCSCHDSKPGVSNLLLCHYQLRCFPKTSVTSSRPHGFLFKRIGVFWTFHTVAAHTTYCFTVVTITMLWPIILPGHIFGHLPNSFVHLYLHLVICFGFLSFTFLSNVVKFVVLMAVTKKIPFVCVITPCMWQKSTDIPGIIAHTAAIVLCAVSNQFSNFV